jgi:hypothetical protein
MAPGTKSEPMTLLYRRVPSLEKSPLPPLSKADCEAPVDLSRQKRWTNLVWSDLEGPASLPTVLDSQGYECEQRS